MAFGAGHAVHGVAVNGTVENAADGTPVAGIALYLGKALVFSNSDGEFMIRGKRAGSLPLVVDLADSFAPWNWTVVSAPVDCTSGLECRVLVERMP